MFSLVIAPTQNPQGFALRPIVFLRLSALALAARLASSAPAGLICSSVPTNRASLSPPEAQSCKGSLMPTLQGFGQHEPLIRLDLHINSWSELSHPEQTHRYVTDASGFAAFLPIPSAMRADDGGK